MPFRMKPNITSRFNDSLKIVIISNISAVHIIPDLNQIQLYKKIAVEFQNWKITQTEKM